MNDKNIEQKGNIVEITSNFVEVRIISESMCASCHARGACGSSDKKEKDIYVKRVEACNFEIGQEVIVVMDRKMGFKAVLLGFLLPFLILFLFVFISNKVFFQNSEIISALIGLLSLGSYYCILYIFKNTINSKFVFRIK